VADPEPVPRDDDTHVQIVAPAVNSRHPAAGSFGEGGRSGTIRDDPAPSVAPEGGGVGCAGSGRTVGPHRGADDVTVKQAAAALELSPRTVYYLCASGEIPCSRRGPKRGAVRIDPADLEEYRARSRAAAGVPSPTLPPPTRRPALCRLDGKPPRHLA
jgi:excisionase family DNA binding protein